VFPRNTRGLSPCKGARGSKNTPTRCHPHSHALTRGTYNFLFKGASHLSKRLENLNLISGDLLLDFTEGGLFALLAGDVHPSKDDYINAFDLSALSAAIFTAFRDADLNSDGWVNGIDVSMLLENLHESGDGI